MRAHISNVGTHMYIRTYGIRFMALYQKDSYNYIGLLPRERHIGDSSLSGKELQAVNESVRDVANDCVRAHHHHSIGILSIVGLPSAIQLLSDGGAPNCMENVMASDTSLYFKCLHD